MNRLLVLAVWSLSCALAAATPNTAAAQAVFPQDQWQVVRPESQSLNPDAIDKVGLWLKQNGSKAGLVVRHGRIVGEWYFDGATPASKHLVYSTTKSLASTAAALAIASGKLKLTSTVGEFFPDAAPAAKRQITVAQLLSMTSGAHNDNSILQRQDLFSYVLRELPMDHPPGEKWDYNNSGLSLLSPVVHKATGQNIDQLLDEGLFRKIGIRRDEWNWEERDGMPLPYSGLHITARGLARVGLLFLNQGMWRSEKVISSDWVKAATAASQQLNPRYGYLWWNNATGAWPGVPSDAFAAMGRFDNDMLVIPSLDMVVIRQVGDDTAANRQLKIGELFALAAAAALDPTPWFDVPETALNVEAVRTFNNLEIERPILLTHAGDGSNRVFIPSQLGTIYSFVNDPQVSQPKVFLDIADRVIFENKENEKGLLGMAFHPKFRDNGQFFVYYTPRRTTKPHTVVVSRFRVAKDDPQRADPDSEQVLLSIEHPFWNHKGGTLAFGPDGCLYIAVGDGGKANDPFGNGQNLKALLGKILRIDVDHADPGLAYAVPQDNPFAGQGGAARGEIWAYGMRNPWRIAFDRATGLLWCADVGQDLWEEIDLVTKGGNYGWNLREGVHKFGDRGADKRSELQEPIWEYHHATGKSITGGMVYRGKKLPELSGCYLYADYIAGKLWALKYDAERKAVVANYSIPGNVMPVVSYGEDEQGEAYYMTDGGLFFTFRAIAK